MAGHKEIEVPQVLSHLSPCLHVEIVILLIDNIEGLVGLDILIFNVLILCIFDRFFKEGDRSVIQHDHQIQGLRGVDPDLLINRVILFHSSPRIIDFYFGVNV